MTTQTFPISPAGKNLVNRITFIVILLSIPFFLFLAFDSPNIFASIILLLTIVLMTYLLLANKFTQFSIDDETLQIKRTLYGKKIDRHTLDVGNARIIDLSQDSNKELRPVIRTNGIGLPYYQAGWFRLRNKEKALLFVTDGKKVLYIPTSEGYALILSVDDSESFINYLTS